MFEIKNIRFQYPNQSMILQDISFQIQRGEICSILGRNGAGKSTLLKCLCGILIPQSGEIKITGKPLANHSPKELAQKITVVRSEGYYIFPYTALEIVLMGRNPHLSFFALPTSKDVAKAKDSLEWVGLGHVMHRKMNDLSSGEKQMVLLARALCQNTEVLLLDEPNSHLDIANQWQLLQKIRSFCTQEKRTVIAVLHLPELAYWFSDQIILLHQGHILDKGPSNTVMTTQNLSQVYGLPMTTQKLHPKYLVAYPQDIITNTP